MHSKNSPRGFHSATPPYCKDGGDEVDSKVFSYLQQNGKAPLGLALPPKAGSGGATGTIKPWGKFDLTVAQSRKKILARVKGRQDRKPLGYA